MSLSYTFKRLIRSWQLHIALLLGIILASTFFAGINVSADTAARQALDQELNKYSVDIVVEPSYYVYGYQQQVSTGVLSSKNLSDAVNSISNLQGVEKAEAITTYTGFEYKQINFTTNIRLIGISESSRIYDGLTGNVPSSLGENETYFWADSSDAGKVHVGNVLPINITTFTWKDGIANQSSMIVNLTVAGFVNLSEQAYSIAMGQYYGYGYVIYYYPNPNLLITSLEKTFGKLMDAVYDSSPRDNPFSNVILVNVDHTNLINPWDIAGSINRLDALTRQINEKVAPYGLSARNNLMDALNNFQASSFNMRFAFIIAALPVFFVAWYMGSTVSDVSFNLRRQEIGLLLTKGFSRKQLSRMFLFEAALIGLLGGAIGIVFSLALSPWFVSAVGGQFTVTPIIGPDSIALTLVFALVVAFLSAYRPARRASNLVAVDALRQYMYVEEAKPYRRVWPWVAFILGAFKIVVLLLGINLQFEMYQLGWPPPNIIIYFLLSILTAIDAILTFVGPFLFFWGFTRLFIRGSLKFQEITAKALKFLGDLGELATKSVRRNPARAAAVAFLIAFIIGYSVQVVGTLASEQDFAIRQIYSSVGADVSVSLNSAENASQIMNTIRDSVSDIESIAVEYTFWASSGFGAYGQRMEIRAVNPSTWPSTAYYESGFFTGSSVEKAFENMRSNNHTIILECNYARDLNKKVGDVVAVTFGENTVEELTITGFFGVEQPETGDQAQQQYYLRYWSYVPEGLYYELGETVVGYSSARILIKIQSGADGEVVADKIRDLPTRITSVTSVAEQLKERQSDLVATGSLNILRSGVVFVVLAASVGTGLVTLVSLRERSREASIMSVRGLSFKQLVVMLLTENLAVVIFAVLLGAVVGLIWVRGIIASQNVYITSSYNPVIRQMVFPSDALLTLLICFTLVFASTILPVIFMAKRYSSRLERVVRQA